MQTTRSSWSRRGMSLFVINGLLLVGIVSASVPDTMVLGTSAKLVMPPDIPKKTCRYSMAYKMLQVNCSNLAIENIPTHLQTDIQIMDARVNRIRGLDSASFSSYKKLAYLYLGDNFIQQIDDGVFSSLYYLEVLDISKNGCDALPNDLFQLPYLRKLYFAENKLTNAILERTVTSPLNYIDLSKNRLTRIPELGAIASLTHLHLSGNQIASISTEEIAPYCSLQLLDLTGNHIKFNPEDCSCPIFHRWIKEHGIKVMPEVNCTVNKRCADLPYSNRTVELYENCTEILRVQVETQKARSVWIVVASSVAAFIVFVFAVLFCIHKRNKRKQRKLKEEQRLAADNANTELVNSNLQGDQT